MPAVDAGQNCFDEPAWSGLLFRHIGGKHADLSAVLRAQPWDFRHRDAGRGSTVRLIPSILIDRHVARPRLPAGSCA